jgi:hypothetical protein
MNINSSAAYASAVNLLQGRSQFQTEQVRQSADQTQQGVTALLGSAAEATKAAPSGGRGQIVDIQA